MQEVVSAKSDDVQSYILNRLEEMSTQMNRIYSRVRENSLGEPLRFISAIFNIIAEDTEIEKEKIISTIFSSATVMRVAMPIATKNGSLIFEVELESRRDFNKVIDGLIEAGYKVEAKLK